MAKMIRPLLVLSSLLLSWSASGQELSAGLLRAAKTQDAAQVQKFLDAGADPNTTDKKGWTALMWAAHFGLTENARALVAKGANVNAQDNIGWTALMSAATKGRAATVRFLLEKGANVNIKDSSGWTALMSAAGSRNLETVKALLESGADVNAKDKMGWTSLMGASDTGQVDTVRALLRTGADRNALGNDGSSALSLARVHNYTEVIAMLEGPTGPPQNKKQESPETKTLNASAGAGALGSGATSHSQPATVTGTVPASKPSAGGPQPESGPSLDSQLLDSAQAGDTAEVQSLLAKGANIDSRGAYGNTPLMSAALTGHTDTLRLLLKKGADVNARGNTGRTALMEAALEDYTEAVKVLLEEGAEVNAKDDGGWTALYWAAFSQRPEVMRALLEKGADANAKNKYDDTALIRAAYDGDRETIKVLLEYKADVNAQDQMGRTALIEAARQDHADAVHALLEKGADAQAKDRDGETALSLAERQKHVNVIALLKNLAISQNKNPEKTTKVLAETSGEANPQVTGTASSDFRIDERTQLQAYFRIGMNMQMVEMSWSQLNDLASGWTQSIEQDLEKVGAPGDLIELASRTQRRLKGPSQENNKFVADLIHDLRARLDGFCNARAEERFSYDAGDFTYRLSSLGEDLTRPAAAKVRIDENRRKIFPLASALADRCLGIVNCRDLALIYFSDAAAILRKARLTSSEGEALRKDAIEIEMILNSDNHY